MMISIKASHTITTLFSLLIFLSFRVSSISIACPEIEKQSLLSFKQSLQDPLNLLSSWNGTEVNCCKWKGVVCSNITGHVHELHLQTSNLTGKLNTSLLSLRYLKYLDLSQNRFNQIFPSFIGSLTSLEYLNLSSIGFYGKIPNNIGNITNLHTLVLEDNSLDVNSLEWLLGLSKLVHLNMNRVDFQKVTNSLEQVINILPSFVELHFSSCNLNYLTAHSSDVHNINTSNLAILDLSYNSFVIPKWIFQLNNLIYLDLSHNSFQGPIPSITNITKLQHIDLSHNNLNSSIPDWLYSCENLEFLNLGYNNLQDSISNSIANLTSLNTLDLSANKLSGGIPQEIGEYCKSLRTLDLSWNSLSGLIPNTIGNLSSLEKVILGGNKLSGNLPESIGKLFNLTDLEIEHNMLEGVVTETHFANLSNLKFFSASGNHLTLKVSPNWIPPFKLSVLRMGSWNLSSPIPSWLETQKNNIYHIDLSNTGIYGNVPSWFWGMNSLNLSCNQLHGNIPVISNPRFDIEHLNTSPCVFRFGYIMYQFIYLGSNKFSGPLPRIGKWLVELDLSNNLFSGDLSLFLCNTTAYYALQNFHLDRNHLSGQLPDCFMKWRALTVLSLDNNNFSGTIPNSIGFLIILRSLNLFGNKLSGHIPFSMQNCTRLLTMNLANNNLDGNIPEWIGTSLSELQFLILRSNKLGGQITPAICQLSSLQILDLSDNIISGVIPRCVNNFTAMTTKRSLDRFYYFHYRNSFQESASIATKGTELTYDTTLPLVNSIDLSKNNLSGDIPNEITILVELRSLNLSRNHLTGLIPGSIGNMKQLESLDFSKNSLSGEIPSSFTVMTSLSYLNLSYNDLIGRIPESTQLRGLKESSFIGNDLCGPPLTVSCSNDGQTPGPTHEEDQDEEGDKPEIKWFYVFLSLEYAVGLSAFFTIFILKKSWMQAFYEFLENMWDTIYVHSYIKWRRLTRAKYLS
ncbi:hypothetical protein CASFOL_035237 [Castilleja foliolosa]|uniref:Leucine-rich repeat-containing N-terminal plant-type domain-containing protein n=1 Tax=Castilleja foliolosa TaxID=1961234 RepID=A0ABD3BS10_9LAMI